LESFVSQKDEAAFEVLIRRHGPMVLGVCRRVLRNHHDAEDAFQTSFLILARKASSVRPRERVANWLHGVAYRTALKARAMTTKRQVHERQVLKMPEPEMAPPDHWHDLRALLDQELSSVPESYRLPILLCDLEGKSIKEATRQLGWPQGTVAGRLARGRKMLAKRLARRGLVLSAGSLATMLSQNVVSAGVPTSLVSATVKATSVIAAGQVAGMIPLKVAALMEGVMKAMLITKLKTVTGALLVVAVAGVGGGLLSRSTTAAAPNAAEGLPKPAANQQASPARTGSPIFGVGANSDAGRAGSVIFGVGVNSDAGLTGSVIGNERNFVTFVDSGTVDQQHDAVEKDFRLAEFYHRTGHLGAAYYYYQRVARSGDRTFAPMTTEIIADLKERLGRQLELAGEWRGRVDGLAITLVFGPQDSVLLVGGDGRWARGSYAVDFKKQPHHLNLHWQEPVGKFKTGKFQTIMQFEEDRRVRIELTGEDEPRPEKFTAKAVVLVSEFRLPSGEKGHPPAKTDHTPLQAPRQNGSPDRTEKKPGRVGQIIVVGNTKTATSELLKKIPLYPGAVLDYQALRTAKKNLAAFDAIITVIENSDRADFKDILVKVKEQ
jgi:RNA polymerase sigma factor (sigma-70 family)